MAIPLYLCVKANNFVTNRGSPAALYCMEFKYSRNYYDVDLGIITNIDHTFMEVP